MERLAGLAAALALTTVVPCAAQEATPGPAPTTGAVAATEAIDTALALGASENRMTVPVQIGTRGPWGFVIDTGAERTAVSRELAGHLGLQAGPIIRVIAMAGVSATPTVIVPSLSVSTVAASTITAPALEQRNLGAAGLLGIDALQGHRIDIDFHQSSMVVKPSRRHYVRAGTFNDEVVVVAKSKFGQLIVTDATWRGKRIAVVIDTGSTLSVGNPAFLALMAGKARRVGQVSATSVTGAQLLADLHVVDDLTIGTIALGDVPVAFADAAPFHRFGLVKRPALMLGMDVLRLFRHVRIDFANRDIQFTLPSGMGIRVVPPGA